MKKKTRKAAKATREGNQKQLFLKFKTSAKANFRKILDHTY